MKNKEPEYGDRDYGCPECGWSPCDCKDPQCIECYPHMNCEVCGVERFEAELQRIEEEG